jgi:hypothetical protein
MPATAGRYGLADPFDADRAIDAQAHLMRDLLCTFAAVPLALAAYNAGPARVRACACVPPIPETQSYVADLLGMHCAGDPSGDGAGALKCASCAEPPPPQDGRPLACDDSQLQALAGFASPDGQGLPA